MRPGTDSDSPVVVMVHGTLDRGGSFNRVARRLEEFTLVTFDRRGYQGSRSLALSRGLQDHIDDVLAVIARVSPDQPVVMFGHSFGGVVAVATAIQSPEKFCHVIAYEPPMPWLIDSAHPHLGVPISESSAKETEMFFRRIMSDDAWDRLNQEEKEDRIADGNGLVGDLSVIRLETPFTVEQLQNFEVPVTIGQGTATTMTHNVPSGALVVETVAHGVAEEIASAGHGAHLSHPGSIAGMIRDVANHYREEPSCAS